MILSIIQLQQAGSLSLEQNLDQSALFDPGDKDIRLSKPIKVNVKARLMNTQVSVSGRVETTVNFYCSRCLEDFDRFIGVDFSEMYEMTPNLEKIDISGEIREAILIGLPMKPLCSESCLGLCPVCGNNQNQKKCQCVQTSSSRLREELKNFPFKNEGK